MPKYDHLRFERSDDTVVVYFLDRRLTAELAISTVSDDLYTVAARPDCLNFVLNFAAVEFLSSAMLGKLVVLNRTIRERGGRLVLCEICPNIRTILKYTGLELILEIHDTEAQALTACKQPTSPAAVKP